MSLILVIEDDADTRQALGEYLTTVFPGDRVVMSESGEAALELVQRTRPSVVLREVLDTSAA